MVDMLLTSYSGIFHRTYVISASFLKCPQLTMNFKAAITCLFQKCVVKSSTLSLCNFGILNLLLNRPMKTIYMHAYYDS